jgi:type II secretory ATPase GspE/PulE/Tfp pilus assembly ATPase PilB-like protein
MPPPRPNPSGSPAVGGSGGGVDTEGVTETTDFELSQIYALIDSILPFEACLYYQVLPLTIEGTRLVIGMVDPRDYGAESYVRRQLAFINYSITTRPIASEWHRNLLSQYLSHTAQNRQETPSSSSAPTQTKTATTSGQPQPEAVAGKPSPAQSPAASPPSSQRASATPASQAPPSSQSSSSASQALPDDAAPTYVVDQPDELESTLPPRPGRPAAPAPAARSGPRPSVGGGNAPLHLYIDEAYESLDDTALASLQPKELMQALLAKVLQEGIGRLYLERQATSGRILWSRDGVLQAVLGDVDALIFQGVINELKLLTHLSLISVRKPRQVEIERLYQGDRILLRFRVMPGSHGEEATLQVLRGTALRFYQQQQIDKLGRDALDAAQALQGRLNEIRDRARQALNFAPQRTEALPAIIQMLKQMESQVHEMIVLYEAEIKAQKQRNQKP